MYIDEGTNKPFKINCFNFSEDAIVGVLVDAHMRWDGG
jgi:hypothetical protein